MAEKEHWWREESITLYAKEEDPISEDSKKTVSPRTLNWIFSRRNLKRTLYYCETLSRQNYQGDPQELQDLQWLLRRKLILFGFLVMVYDRVDDGDKFSKKKFVLGKLHFHATSHLKVSPVLALESKIVSVYMVYLQGMSHQFQINVISAFHNKFWSQFGKLFKRFWFFAFDIWKKRRQCIFNLLFFSD